MLTTSLLSLSVISSPVITCPTYTCQTVNSTFCGVFNTTTNIVSISDCPEGSFCPSPSPGSNTQCQNQPNPTGFAWAGEVCNSTFACAGQGSCVNGRCTSPEPYGPCESNFDCGVNQYCDPDYICGDVQPVGSACVSDYQCLQNSACDVSISMPYGRCVLLLSRPPGATVASCEGGLNMLCSSGLCTSSEDGGICMTAVSSNAAAPIQCTTNTQCSSQVDPITNVSLTQLCTCGFTSTGSAFCPSFPGDSAGMAYMVQLKAWVNSTAILSCATQRRLSLYCMFSNWNTGDWLKYLNAYLQYTMYPLVQANPPCVKQTFAKDYWLAEEAYQKFLQKDNAGVWLTLIVLLEI